MPTTAFFSTPRPVITALARRSWTLPLLLAAAVLLSARSGATEPEPSSRADLVIIDANLLTIDEQQPTAEAMAIVGERIVAVGSNETVRSWIGPKTNVLDAGGRTIVPGFHDAHIHPSPKYDPMSPLGRVDCGPENTPTIDSLVEKLSAKAAVTPAGQWVRGSRYQDTKLGRHPTRADLDRVSTKHPVYVSHSSGHVAAVNSFALKLADITAETEDPPGGRFDRDADGVPNGVLRESARSIVRRRGPEDPVATTAEWLQGIQARFDDYLARGVTAIQHAGTNTETIEKYLMAQADETKIRIFAMHRSVSELDELMRRIDQNDRWLRTGAIKMFHGNSLSGQTCWLREPYAGRPNYYGIPPARTQESLNDRVSRIHDAGFQACIHANGDREIEMVLDAFEHALRKSPRENHRHRIEHASVCPDRLLPRIKQLGVVLAPHSYVWEHGDKMEAYGERRWNHMHPNKSATDAGIPVAGNSDSPVSQAHPLLRIQSMVTRTSAEGKVYGPRQRVSVEEALRIWTLGSAYACFAERDLGSLTVGKLADFVILSDDPRHVPPESLRHICVEATYVGGVRKFGTAAL
jgi:hypothetical protein